MFAYSENKHKDILVLSRLTSPREGRLFHRPVIGVKGYVVLRMPKVKGRGWSRC